MHTTICMLQCYTDSAYLKVAAIGGNKLILIFLSLLCVEHHPPHPFIEVSVVEGKVMPGKFSTKYK